jgi:hypothetical protein
MEGNRVATIVKDRPIVTLANVFRVQPDRQQRPSAALQGRDTP